MEDPFKIIWRCKSSTNKIQYHMYIFVGNAKPANIYDILNKIQHKTFFKTLIDIEHKEYAIMEKEYGEYWYEKFFGSAHIAHMKILFNVKDSSYQTVLKDKYGDEWFKKHIIERDIFAKKLIYSYEDNIHEEKTRKVIRKIIRESKGAIKEEDENLDDYTTVKKMNFSKLVTGSRYTVGAETELKDAKEVLNVNKSNQSDKNSDSESDTEKNIKMQKGGKNKKREYASESETAYKLLSKKYQSGGKKKKESKINENSKNDENKKSKKDKNTCVVGSMSEFNEFMKSQNLNREDDNGDTDDSQNVDVESDAMDDYENTSLMDTDETLDEETTDLEKDKEDEPDTNLESTTKMIKEVMEKYDNKDELKLYKSTPFDTEKDENTEDNLQDVYRKNYVTSQYIFRDDTIKTIKMKICAGIQQDPLIDKSGFVLPSRQYLWTEYIFENKVERVMLGQKWLQKNKILAIDIEPNPNIRVYEQLRDKLKSLRDSMRRVGTKIKKEEDEHKILQYYINYITNNELYMIDIYHELGNGYNAGLDDHTSEKHNNIKDFYLKIYFPRVKEDWKSIIDYLNGDKAKESLIIEKLHNTIENDLIPENQVTKYVETVRREDYKKFKSYFGENYVTQSVIHVNLKMSSQQNSTDENKTNFLNKKINLYRIFDNFQVNDPDGDYPFIQMQLQEGNPVYKFNPSIISKKENNDMKSKWMENSPYGISFKIRTKRTGGDRYLAVLLQETGRIEYKEQWKEENMATVDDIKNTYMHIRNIVEKINSENSGLNLQIPKDTDFRYAFINILQKFQIPKDYLIDHNDLSDFAVFFFPYISVVIEPRKRKSRVAKNVEKSKYGTYLRYRRVSDYENQIRIEQRILYIMRNYEYNDQNLAIEITKQFNITEAKAHEEIQKVVKKYPMIRKSRKILKKLESIPKYKPPGIGIDIQGRAYDRYKIRIPGIRDKEQMDRILLFMNILIYLYVETYLLKIPERQFLKEKLKHITNIARRRNRVEELVRHTREINVSKQMTSLDTARLGLKATKGQASYTRQCQNSGLFKKRRPQLFKEDNLEDLIKRGYKLNKKTGNYERKLKDGKTLTAVKLPELDDTLEETGNNVFYSCNPEENGKDMFIGFMHRSSKCMPCCFRKNPMLTRNSDKKEYHMKCLGLNKEEDTSKNKVHGDPLYLLQDTNKLLEGRMGYLPKNLDIFLNTMMKKERETKHYYLIKSKTGYYFKLGINVNDQSILSALSAVLGTNIESIIQKITEVLEKDKNDIIFTSLNNGDLKTQFKSRDDYILYLKNTNIIDLNYIYDILSIPKILTVNGINLIIFQKVPNAKKDKVIEQTTKKDDYVPICLNAENDHNYLDRDNILLIQEEINGNDAFFPIILITKKDEKNKEFDSQKTFGFQEDENNIVNHIMKYFKLSCKFSNIPSAGKSTKETYSLLQTSGKEFLPKYQVIDSRNKCKYLIIPFPENSQRGGSEKNNKKSKKILKLESSEKSSESDSESDSDKGNYSTSKPTKTKKNFEYLIIPVSRSGTLYNVTIIPDTQLDKFSQSFKKTMEGIATINSLIKDLHLIPSSVYYSKKEKDSIHTTAIKLNNGFSIPIKPEIIKISSLENLKAEHSPLYDKIDNEIRKGSSNFFVDDRIKGVSRNEYFEEGYQLFRLEFSNFLLNNPNIKSKLEAIVYDQNESLKSKRKKIKEFMYKNIDDDLHEIYLSSNKTSSSELSRENDNSFENETKNLKNNDDIVTDSDSDIKSENNSNSETESTSDEDSKSESNSKSEEDQHSSVEKRVQEKKRKKNKFMVLKDELSESMLNNYEIKNLRTTCDIYDKKDSCSVANHCSWTQGKCKFYTTYDYVIDYVNKITEELANNEVQAWEVLRRGSYYISEIVDMTRFTSRSNQKIVKSVATNIKKVMEEVFGKENVPVIGKKRYLKSAEIDYKQKNEENPMKDLGDFYIQSIIPNNNSIIRAFTNSIYWHQHMLYDISSRNLGYFSPIQTDFTNYFKSEIIKWLLTPANTTVIDSQLIKYMYIKQKHHVNVRNYVIKFSEDIYGVTSGVVEFFVLSKLYPEYQIMIYNENNEIVYIFEDGLVYEKDKTESPEIILKKYDTKERRKKSIIIRFNYKSDKFTPEDLEVLFYK